jgi:hypothetical protein
MTSLPPELAAAVAREIVDIEYPEAPVEFFRQHGFSGSKGWLDAQTCAALADELRAVHAEMATTTNPAIPFLSRLPWPITSLPEDMIARLRLRDLAELAEDLYGGTPARAFSWQAFARKAGEPATPLHSDGDFVPMSGPGVAFWIPLTPTPERTGLVALTDIDGSGPRPVRQSNQDPGDLTWHNLEVLHWAEDLPVDFVALGFGTFPDGAKIDIGTRQPIAQIRALIARRVFGAHNHGDPALSASTPFLKDLPG